MLPASKKLSTVKKLLEYLVSSIVEKPDEVTVEELVRDGQTDLIIHANQDDLKIIIGKNGKTIKALRELVKVKAILEKKRVNIQVAED